MERRRGLWIVAGAAALGAALSASLPAAREVIHPQAPSLVSIAPDSLLLPPTQLVRTATGELVVLAVEGEKRTLTLYRSGPQGDQWQRWQSLTAPAGIREVDMTSAGNLLAVAATEGHAIWLGSLPLESEAQEHPAPHTTEFLCDRTVLSLALAGTAPAAMAPATTGPAATAPAATAAAADAAPQLHLAYLTGDPPDTERVIFHRWSHDGGLNWSEPHVLAQGALGPVDLSAQPDSGRSVELGYSRGGFLRWRRLTGSDASPEVEVRVAVAPGSQNALACLGPRIAIIGESERHQVVGSVSENGGHNWGRAIAMARASRHFRVPDIAAAFGRFWIAYSFGDSAVVARSSTNPWHPKNWGPPIFIAHTLSVGSPSVVALSEDSAGVLFAAQEGKIYFVRVGK